MSALAVPPRCTRATGVPEAGKQKGQGRLRRLGLGELSSSLARAEALGQEHHFSRYEHLLLYLLSREKRVPSFPFHSLPRVPREEGGLQNPIRYRVGGRGAALPWLISRCLSFAGRALCNRFPHLLLEALSGNVAVGVQLARILAGDRHAGRDVRQLDAVAHLVDLLSAGPTSLLVVHKRHGLHKHNNVTCAFVVVGESRQST